MGNNHGIHHVHPKDSKSQMSRSNSKVDLPNRTLAQNEQLSPMEKLGKVSCRYLPILKHCIRLPFPLVLGQLQDLQFILLGFSFVCVVGFVSKLFPTSTTFVVDALGALILCPPNTIR